MRRIRKPGSHHKRCKPVTRRLPIASIISANSIRDVRVDQEKWLAPNIEIVKVTV